jgi:hypothetical protein
MGNPPLIVGLLINGVAYAAIFIVVAVLLSRFTSEVVWRSFLVLFLFIAAGVYIVFAVRAGEGILWVLGELAGVAIFGGRSPYHRTPLEVTLHCALRGRDKPSVAFVTTPAAPLLFVVKSCRIG